MLSRGRVSPESQRRYEHDRELAGRLGALLDAARQAEAEVRRGDAGDPAADRERTVRLDAALTEAMRAAYAAQRVAIGPRGYDDRIVRRKRMARPEVRVHTELAERLLTLREDHRLHGVARVPRVPAA